MGFKNRGFKMLKKYVIIALCALNMAGTASSMSYFRRFTAPISASIALYSANYFGSKPAKSEESPEIAKLISRSDSSLWHLTQSRAGSLKSSEWIKSLSEPGATVRTQGHRKFSNSWNAGLRAVEGEVIGVERTEYKLTSTAGDDVSIEASGACKFIVPTDSRVVDDIRQIYSRGSEDDFAYMQCKSFLNNIDHNEKTGRSTLNLSRKCSGSVPKNVLEWAVLNPEKIATEADKASEKIRRLAINRAWYEAHRDGEI